MLQNSHFPAGSRSGWYPRGISICETAFLPRPFDAWDLIYKVPSPSWGLTVHTMTFPSSDILTLLTLCHES